MEEKRLRAQVARLESQVDHLESEITEVNELLEAAGIGMGLDGLKSALLELIRRSEEKNPFYG